MEHSFYSDTLNLDVSHSNIELASSNNGGEKKH